MQCASFSLRNSVVPHFERGRVTAFMLSSSVRRPESFFCVQPGSRLEATYILLSINLS